MSPSAKFRTYRQHGNVVSPDFSSSTSPESEDLIENDSAQPNMKDEMADLQAKDSAINALREQLVVMQASFYETNAALAYMSEEITKIKDQTTKSKDNQARISTKDRKYVLVTIWTRSVGIFIFVSFLVSSLTSSIKPVWIILAACLTVAISTTLFVFAKGQASKSGPTSDI